MFRAITKAGVGNSIILDWCITQHYTAIVASDASDDELVRRLHLWFWLGFIWVRAWVFSCISRPKSPLHCIVLSKTLHLFAIGACDNLEILSSVWKRLWSDDFLRFPASTSSRVRVDKCSLSLMMKFVNAVFLHINYILEKFECIIRNQERERVMLLFMILYYAARICLEFSSKTRNHHLPVFRDGAGSPTIPCATSKTWHHMAWHSAFDLCTTQKPDNTADDARRCQKPTPFVIYCVLKTLITYNSFTFYFIPWQTRRFGFISIGTHSISDF